MYTDIMSKINQQTAEQLTKIQFPFIRLIVRFSGDCTIEYGYSKDTIKLSQTVPYAMMGLASKTLALKPKNSETIVTTLGGIVIEYDLILSNNTSFTDC